MQFAPVSTLTPPPQFALPSEPAFLVVDVETTGGGQGAHRIIEIGAVKVRGGEVVREFSTLLDPQRPLPYFITQLTGIPAEALVGAPRAAEVAPLFAELLDGAVVVAHNSSFDSGFLVAEQFVPPAYPTLCTIKLGRRITPGLKSYSLDSLAAHLGVEITGRHRALGDARATAEILRRFLVQLEERGIRGFEAIKKFETMAVARAKKLLAIAGTPPVTL